MNSLSNYSYVVKIVKQPPQFVALKEWFEVVLAIERLDTSTNNINDIRFNLISHLNICPCVNEIPGTDICNDTSLVTKPETICMNLKGSSKRSKDIRVMCKVLSPSLLKDNITRYLISFSPRISNQPPLSSGMPFTTMRPIHIVTAMLSVDNKNWPFTWFKDEGGKGKCIEAKVSLLDVNKATVKERYIPLNITLLYDTKSSTKVMKQETLRLFSHQYSIDPKKGECLVRFRIEDVSKNHQGLNFKLEISPDMSKVFDIASTCTPPVCVRSKRKRSKKRPFSELVKEDDHIHPHPVIRSGESVEEYADVPSYIEKDLKEPKVLEGVPDIQSVRKAMKGVIDWTEEVINGLGHIIREPMLYQNNPNELIKKILSKYSDETRSDLQIVRNAVENTRNINPQELQPVIEPKLNLQMQQQSFEGSSEPTEFISCRKFPVIRNKMHSYGKLQGTPHPMNASSHTMQHQVCMQQMSPSIFGRQVETRHQVSNHKFYSESDERKFTKQHTSSSLSTNMDQFGTNHNEIGVYTIGRNQEEIDLDCMQDEKVDEEMKAKGVEKTIKYILAKHFKSKWTGKQLGFPAFNRKRIIVGFYRESAFDMCLSRFVLLSQLENDFEPTDILQATYILEDAIERKHSALHSLQDYESLHSMIEHVMVSEWTKNLFLINDFSPRKIVDDNYPMTPLSDDSLSPDKNRDKTFKFIQPYTIC